MAEGSTSLDISDRVKAILRRDLKLGTHTPIPDDMPLIGGDFDLDSLDMVMLVTSVEKEFHVKIAGDTSWRGAFQSVGSLTAMLQQRTGPGACASAGNGNGSTSGGATAATPNAGGAADLSQILAGLPHGQPFRFVSRLTQWQPRVDGRGEWSVTGSEAFLAGHFPGRPIIPGVLIAEALAQLCGLVGSTPKGAPGAIPGAIPGAGDTVRLAQVDVRFRQTVTPPAVIGLASRLTQAVDATERYDVQATVGATVIAEGTVVLHRGA